MNFDILAAVDITAVAVIFPAGVILASPLDAARQRGLAYIVGGWFALVTGLAAKGAGPPAIGAAVVLTVIAALIARRRSTTIRSLAAGTPLALLVAMHATRLLGVEFVILYAIGRLPPTFALSAGLGDMLTAILAVPLAFAIHRRVSGWQRYALAWNVLGFLDLLAALSLGVGSSPGFPLRFIFEQPDSGPMGNLPWFLIPGFLVPLYLVTHLFIFARLLGSSADSPSNASMATLGVAPGGAQARP